MLSMTTSGIIFAVAGKPPIACDTQSTRISGQLSGGSSSTSSREPKSRAGWKNLLTRRLAFGPLRGTQPDIASATIRWKGFGGAAARLTISESGRVTAVDPVGTADREFLDAGRRHLIAHWRYQPATEDGRAIASFTVVTLRVQLDG